MAIILACIVIISVSINSYAFLHVYGVYQFDITRHESWLIGAVSVINIIKASIIVFMMRYRSALNQLAILLKWFIVANAVLILVILLNGYLFDPLVDNLLYNRSSETINSALIVCLSILVGISYGFIGLSLLDLKIQLNGYRIALAIACISSCAAMFLFFFETFRLISLLLLDLSLLAFSISLLLSKKPLFHLQRGLPQKAFIGTLWVLPVSLYVVFSGYTFFKTTQFDLASLYGLENAVFSENANVKDVNAYFRDDKFIPKAVSTVNHEFIFKDLWFVSNKEVYALDQGNLYKSIDGGDKWDQYHKLDVVGENVQFDHSGQYGWIGSKWGPIEVTENSGKDWRVVDPEKIYRKLADKNSDDELLETQSVLYLNSETKTGSFIMGCHYYYTSDFANNWEKVKVEKGNGENLCLVNSPFALNKQRDLAVAMILEKIIVYRKQTNSSQWQPLCGLDSDSVANDKIGDCAAIELNKKEKEFIRLYSNEEHYLRGNDYSNDTIDTLVNDMSYPVNQLKWPVLKAADTQWIAGEGLLLTTTNMGMNWQVKRYVPMLTNIRPVSASKAVAWGRNLVPYVSSNYGKTWQQLLEIKKEEGLNDIYFDSKDEVLWILFSKRLQKINLNSLKKETLFEWNDDQYSDIGASPDGERLWLFNRYESKISLSADRGKKWQEVNIVLDFIDKEHDDYWLEIRHVFCNTNEQSCFLLTEDRGIYEIKHLDGQFILQTSPVARLPEEVEDFEGYIYSGSNGNQFLYIEGYGRNAYLSHNGGQSWDKQSLIFRQNWSRPQLSKDGKNFFIPGNGRAVITRNFGEKWAYISPDGWEDNVSFCWDTKKDFIFIFNDSDFAASFDGGDNWVKNYHYRVEAPSCGIGNGYLWLKTYGVSVYQL